MTERRSLPDGGWIKREWIEGNLSYWQHTYSDPADRPEVVDIMVGANLWQLADPDRDQKVRDALVEKIIEKYGIEHYVTSAVHLTFDELRDLAREGDDRCTVMIEGGEVVSAKDADTDV